MGELFEDSRCKDPPVIEDCSGPPIIEAEVEAAIRQTKGGKAPGNVEVSEIFGVEKLTLQ